MERILSIKEQAYGEEDPRIRSALYSAGAALARCQRAANCRLERALAIDEQEFGREVKVAVALTTPTEAYKVDEEKAAGHRDIFDLEGLTAKALWSRARRRRRRRTEPDSPIPESEDDDQS